MNDLLKELNNKAASLFSVQLDSNAEASKYALSRGLSKDTTNHFNIGYAPDSWQELSKSLDSDMEIKEALAGGLIAESENGRRYDFFRNRLMFPIKSIDGDVIAFGGRDLDKESKVKYLNSPETPLFSKQSTLYNLDFAKKYSDLVVVEGYMDVVKAYEKSLPNFVATLGTAFTNKHADLLVSQDLRSVTFCFDGDKAGYKAAISTIDNCEPLLNSGIMVRFAFMPNGQDPDDILEAGGRDALIEELNQAVSPAAFIVKHHIESLYSPDAEPPIDLALKGVSDSVESARANGINLSDLAAATESLPDGLIKRAIQPALSSEGLNSKHQSERGRV